MIDYFAEEAVALPGSFSAYDMMAVYPTFKKSKKVQVYLEVGVQNGRSLLFARKHFKGSVYGIDRNHELHTEAFKDYKDWQFIHKPSNEAVKDWTLPIDVLFIDGDHTYEGVKDDWDNFSPFVKKGGMVFFHDCDETSPGVVKLWQSIKKKKGLSRDDLEGRNTSISWVKM